MPHHYWIVNSNPVTRNSNVNKLIAASLHMSTAQAEQKGHLFISDEGWIWVKAFNMCGDCAYLACDVTSFDFYNTVQPALAHVKLSGENSCFYFSDLETLVNFASHFGFSHLHTTEDGNNPLLGLGFEETIKELLEKRGFVRMIHMPSDASIEILFKIGSPNTLEQKTPSPMENPTASQTPMSVDEKFADDFKDALAVVTLYADVTKLISLTKADVERALEYSISRQQFEITLPMGKMLAHLATSHQQLVPHFDSLYYFLNTYRRFKLVTFNGGLKLYDFIVTEEGA